MKAKVLRVCKREHEPTKHDVYIGRGSVFGNPYSHLDSKYKIIKVATREEAITKFELMMDKKLNQKNSTLRKETLKLLNRLKKGENLYLVCYCPSNCSCHGDYIATVLRDAYKRWLESEAKRND